MDIIISNASEKPIYEQISSQIKAQIMSGQLKEGELLPSMRGSTGIHYKAGRIGRGTD